MGRESVAAQLTREFYLWEQRGRGWTICDGPVALEPPFTPFAGYHLPESAKVDDGRKPTPLSALLDGLRGVARQGPAASQEDFEEPKPEPFVAPGSYSEIRISAPADLSVSPQLAENFLNAMPSGIGPVTFEILATKGRIWTQFACASWDEASVTRQLRAQFPDAVLGPGPGLRETWKRAGRGGSVVVDFGLSNEFMLPLATFRKFDPDPLTGIIGSLSDLSDEEVTVVQVLFQLARNPWAKSILRAVTDGTGRPFFANAPEITALAEAKVSRPLFWAVLRVGARSRNADQAWERVRALSGALSVLGDAEANELIPLSNDGYPDSVHEEDLLERRSRRSGFLLNSAELSSLVHPPSAAVRVEQLQRHARRTRSAPAIAVGHDLMLGTNVHAGNEITVSLSPDQRTRHTYVIGASGTGKSTLLLSMILQDLERGEGLAVLDPHGDLIDEILNRLPQSRVDDVCLLDPADAEYPIGFNILSAHSELERTLLASDLVAVFQRLSSRWGDQMTSVLGNAILAILESEQGGTLVDLRRFLVEPKFRKDFLRTVQDPDIVYYWEKEFPLLSGKPQASLLTRLDTFLRPKPIRYMVAQKQGLDFAKLMNEGKILLARLSQGAIGEENAYLMGTLLVSKFQQIAMSRQELQASERRPFYLYVDEFHNFVTPSMAAILSGARKYRLGLVLAHQDLQQLASRDPEVLNSVISNPYTRICFRVGDHDARRLEEGFASFTAQDLQNLATGQAIARIERADFDFSIDTPMLDSFQPGYEAVREQVVASSRGKYARKREEIEQVLRDATAEQKSAEPISRKAPVVPPLSTEALVPPERPVRVAPVEEGASPPVPVHGRGGAQHKYIQELIRNWAEGHGWRAIVEDGVLDGLGSVDVALRKGEQSVACEISMSTSPEHELGNVQKCLAVGFDHVAVVSPEKATLGRIRKVVREQLSELDGARVHFVQPEELFTFLEGLEAEQPASECTVRGYRVKVKYQPLDPKDKSAKKQAVSQVIAKALRRLKDKNAPS